MSFALARIKDIAFHKIYVMKAEKLCMNCREVIRGRSDKKFCGDHCRSNYNYKRTGVDHLNLVRSVNRTLNKNRRILKNLNKNGKTRVPRKYLSDRGFNFSYHTSIHETAQCRRYYLCYDVGYLSLDDNDVLLVNKELLPIK